MTEKMIRTLHTQIIELDGGKNLCLRILDNGMVDVTVELSESECYGLDVPWGLFLHSMSNFLYELKDS